MSSETKVSRVPPIIIMFAPEQWGSVTKFSKFANTTYKFTKKSANALNGIEGHIQKYFTLRTLAERLIPSLQEDLRELEEQRYTPASRSKELAAVIETLFCELYASLDCMREVLRAVLRDQNKKPLQGIPEVKTSRLFSNAAEGKLAPEVPVAISMALASAHNDWFPKLRDIRTGVTHFDVGHCSLGGNKKVNYMNVGLGSRERAYVIEDVFERLTEFEKNVNQLLGVIFTELMQTLEDTPTRQFCCVFEGHIYERSVTPGEAIDNNSGICVSYKWFEKKNSLPCPLARTCKAYNRAKSRK